ncbi:MAG TPA: S8 family serine peptidase [Terriglobales bacterium]|nr:S8 family serine peptidase [Terriglobales bacterium]
MGTNYQSTIGTQQHSRPRALRAYFALLLLLCLGAQSLAAQAASQTRLVVRDSLGLTNLLNLCKLVGCAVDRGLGDPSGQLFLVRTPKPLNAVVGLLNVNLGVISIETDQVVQTQAAEAGPAPSYLTDTVPVNYYGTTVWRGYVTQPGNQLILTDKTHTAFNTAGANVIVAVIDTGVDPTHPVLKNSLVTGYDFTRGTSGGSEDADVSQSTVAVLDHRTPAKVNQSTVAVLEQSSVAVLDGPQYAAFGHGTMVSGIVHLVAPQAKIMPLKAFHADGTGYNSDILNAIYYAVNHGAKVINMSFSYSNSSQELTNAVNYANSMGVVCVAAAGNDGQRATVYPAALKNVIDVASAGDNDIRSTFSNYGAPPVWLTAPGEGIMTTYPYGTWAAGWGTSFSAPLVSGATALLMSSGPAPVSLKALLQGNNAKTQAAAALSHAQPISDRQMGYGRLDTYQAMQAWRKAMGLK